MCQPHGEVTACWQCTKCAVLISTRRECTPSPLPPHLLMHHKRKLRRTTGARDQHSAEAVGKTVDIEDEEDDEESSEEADEDSWSSSEGEDDDEESSHFEGYDTSDDWTSSDEDEDDSEEDQAWQEAEHRRCVTSASALYVHAWARGRGRQGHCSCSLAAFAGAEPPVAQAERIHQALSPQAACLVTLLIISRQAIHAHAATHTRPSNMHACRAGTKRSRGPRCVAPPTRQRRLRRPQEPTITETAWQ